MFLNVDGGLWGNVMLGFLIVLCIFYVFKGYIVSRNVC